MYAYLSGPHVVPANKSAGWLEIDDDDGLMVILRREGFITLLAVIVLCGIFQLRMKCVNWL
jgi:hypothetical protein